MEIKKMMTATKAPPSSFSYTGIMILIISIVIFSCSCVKQTIPTNPVPTKPISPTSPTDSKIIYTDVNPDSAILLGRDSFNLDLNKDSLTDFEFLATLSSSECRSGAEGERLGIFIRLSVTPENGNSAVMTSAPNVAFAFDLDSSATIGPDSSWVNTTAVLLEGAEISNCNAITGHAGYWLNVSDKYLGLKFTAANNTYYGWARLSSTYLPGATPYFIIGGELIIKDYAYNSVPNQPILAGQTK